MIESPTALFESLNNQLDGSILSDSLTKTLYATDASVYREMPLAVAFPKSEKDIKYLIHFANEHSFALIPRTAGTSLAGQCVGKGIVVDVSKYFTEILEINEAARYVRLQPGVIRDELNRILVPHGLFFGPNTSTANRCMIGGMVGNNSSGSTSIKYGVTRDKLLEVKGFLSDGSSVHFKALTNEELAEKLKLDSLEGEIYRHLYGRLTDEGLATAIKQSFPHADIHRRNTGYALDVLLNMEPFNVGGNPFNLSSLIAGSEGTLLFITEICVAVDFLPPAHELILCPHFVSVEAALEAVGMIMEEKPYACELMDKVILDCTKGNKAQEENRFFIEGDPGAVLMIELRGATLEELASKAAGLKSRLKSAGHGYSWPVVNPPDTGAVWELRKAGLGLLSNMEGEAKAVACIEDTAVRINDLPAYIKEFSALMDRFGQQAVYYAHAGAGELHLRPVLNLKKKRDVQLFADISEATAVLVKKYGGSLSGEHGDGRVRAPFLPLMFGEHIYQLFVELKETWDPKGIFNPGKITHAAPITANLRYEAERVEPVYQTLLDFSEQGGFLGLAEKCNGSGDCRKLPNAGGAMCPSYHVTRDEKHTTRGRANILRELLTNPGSHQPFAREEINDALKWCLSCKACSHECPSSVDMSKLKAEFLYQYHQMNGWSFRDKMIASIGEVNKFAARFPAFSNFILKNHFTAAIIKRMLGFSAHRSLPSVESSLLSWFVSRVNSGATKVEDGRTVYFFFDEFTTYQETKIGKAAIKLLEGLGYNVAYLPHGASGRAQLSKGRLKEAAQLAVKNVRVFAAKVGPETPLVGVEPSAVYTFRDEYPDLVGAELKDKARQLGKSVMLVEDFLAKEIKEGRISSSLFTKKKARILFHGHCHQKALANVDSSAWLLSLPENYVVEMVPSGCCGMAGSFGYEKENYELSLAIGEQVLFPALRKADEAVIIAATGSSCRQQIADGVGKKAKHPVEIIWEAFTPDS